MKNVIMKNKCYLILPYIIITMLCLKNSGATYIMVLTLIPLLLAVLPRKLETIRIKYIILFSLTIIYLSFSLINTDIVSAIKGYVPILNIIVPIIVYDCIISKSLKNSDNLKIIKTMFSILLIYTVIVTWYYIDTDIYFARNLANYNDLSNSQYTGLAVASGGGYSLIYGIILLPVVLLTLLKDNTIKKKQKLSYVCIILILSIFVIKANFATAFIIMLIGIVFGIFNLIKQKKLLFFVAFLLIIVLVILNIKSVLSITISLLPENSIISIRLNEVIEYMNSTNVKDDQDSFSNRISLLKRSAISIIQYPLGVGYSLNFNYNQMMNKLGLHNEWLDIVGKYGIIVGGLIIVFILMSFMDLYKDFKGNNHVYGLMVTIGMIILLGFFNPINTTSIILIEFIYVPCLLIEKNIDGKEKMINKKENNK